MVLKSHPTNEMAVLRHTYKYILTRKHM